MGTKKVRQKKKLPAELGDYLDTAQVAKYLGVSVRFLEGLRTDGRGPRFLCFGRSRRYRKTDVDTWAATRSAHTTAEVPTDAAR